MLRLRIFHTTFIHLVFAMVMVSISATKSLSKIAEPEELADHATIAGTYYTILHHESTNFFQYARITLRTMNPNTQVQISANMRVYLGGNDSNEFLTYDFDNVPLNILTRQISLSNETNDLSLTGFLRNGEISGEWFSSLEGRVGTFHATRNSYPSLPEGASLVTPLAGHYRGSVENSNPDAHVPEHLTMSFVTTQENSNPNNPTLKISGSMRFYFSSFDSTEYIELSFNDVQFNLYSRFLTAKTSEYGFTIKGTVGLDGQFAGTLYADGLGEIGPIAMMRHVITAE